MSAAFSQDLFRGKVALITGGGTGIGKAIAVAFAGLGADIAIASRQSEHLHSGAEALAPFGCRVHTAVCDIRDAAQCEATVASTIATLGRIDFLINNAGANFASAAVDISPNGWHAVVDVVLNGTFHMCRAASQALSATRGAVVMLSATNAEGGSAGMAHSGAAKAGLISLTESLAVEWGAAGVRVNAICPGPIDTAGANARLWSSDASYRAIADRVPLGHRLGTPDDCVGAVLFLCSPAAGFITGASLPIDGGHRLRQLPLAPTSAR